MDHAHHHHEHGTGSTLRDALVLTLVVLVIEVVAGFASNSLALLADAGHILTDAFSLGLAWFASRLAERGPDARYTFGYRRSPILAALANAFVLLVIAVVITLEAVQRIGHPPQVRGTILIPAAILAIMVNLWIAFGLRDAQHESLNVRAAFLHVIGDIAASIAVIVAGVAILVWRAYLVDPILSIGVALLIAVGAWRIVRETLGVLMESTPPGIDLEAMMSAMQEVPGVLDVHDLHVWALSDGYLVLSAHVVVPEQTIGEVANLIEDVKLLLRKRFHIDHATIETECVDSGVTRRRPVAFHDTPRPGAG